MSAKLPDEDTRQKAFDAVSRQTPDVLEAILKEGYHPDSFQDRGTPTTLLQYAVGFADNYGPNAHENVRILCTYGANPDGDNTKINPHSPASVTNSPMKYLQKYGETSARQRVKNNGNTPGTQKVLEILESCGSAVGKGRKRRGRTFRRKALRRNRSTRKSKYSLRR